MKKLMIFLLIGCLSALLLAGCNGDHIAEVSQPEESVVSEATMTTPTKAEVESARALVLEGMDESEKTALTEFIKTANRSFEQVCLGDTSFEDLSDQDSLYWNKFVTKGTEVQIGWAYEAEVDKEAVCRDENLTEEAFYQRYGNKVVVDVTYDLYDFAEKIEAIKDTVQNEALRTDLQTMATLAREAQEQREVKNFRQILEILHDMDYFLLRYGLELEPTFTDAYDRSYLTTYNGTLTIYQ